MMPPKYQICENKRNDNLNGHQSRAYFDPLPYKKGTKYIPETAVNPETALYNKITKALNTPQTLRFESTNPYQPLATTMADEDMEVSDKPTSLRRTPRLVEMTKAKELKDTTEEDIELLVSNLKYIPKDFIEARKHQNLKQTTLTSKSKPNQNQQENDNSSDTQDVDRDGTTNKKITTPKHPQKAEEWNRHLAANEKKMVETFKPYHKVLLPTRMITISHGSTGFLFDKEDYDSTPSKKPIIDKSNHYFYPVTIKIKKKSGNTNFNDSRLLYAIIEAIQTIDKDFVVVRNNDRKFKYLDSSKNTPIRDRFLKQKISLTK